VDGVDPATGEVLASGAAATASTPAKKAPAKKPAAKKAAAAKPRTASIFKSMDLATVDLETALRLLDLPRVVGDDPETATPITAQNGKYGPYLKKGTDSRSLTSEEQIFEIDLPGALEVFAQPKYGARRPSSALKEFDADPVSGKGIKVKDGRFGPYVTDGETNATIPKSESVEDVDFDRAVELLADKRAKGPAKPKAKAPAKAKAKAPAKPRASAAAKTTAAKTTTAKTTAAKSTSSTDSPAKSTAAKTTRTTTPATTSAADAT
jgi:DNA topoisomerase-1